MTKTFGSIEFNKKKNQWIITKAQPHVCIKLKRMFEKIAQTSVAPFTFQNTSDCANDLLWFLERYPMDISDKDLRLMKRQKAKFMHDINVLESILMPTYSPADVGLKKGEKRLYQLQGKDYYLAAKRLLIGDDIGLGKTLIAILSFLENNTQPACVVVQTHLPKQWKEKIEEFTDLKVHIMQGTKPYNLPPADVYITCYSRIRGWVDVFKSGFFKSVVFDEIQELRLPGSQKYQAASVLSGAAQYCLGLSASPVYNYGDEIYYVMDLIKPGCLGGVYDFMREWTGGGFNGRNVKDPQALGTYLRDNGLMLRRTRKEVGKELPPINKIVHTVECDESEVEKIEELAWQLAVKTTSGTFVERGSAARDLDALVRQATGVSKAHGVAAYVKILLDNNIPVVLAGWHRRVYEIWNEDLKAYNPVMYTGTESPSMKSKAVEDFVSGKTNLFIISLRSGIGIDGLQDRCNVIVYGELDWSPKVHDQLAGRLDRERQTEQVMAIYLTSDEGSDPVIIDMLGIKSSQAHGITDPLEMMPDQHSDLSRIKVLAEQYLKKRGHAVEENVKLK